MSTLAISLFGTVRVENEQLPQGTKISPKALALLSYLLLQGPRLHPREVLINLLWRDHSIKKGRGCLSTTLWRLRQILEPETGLQGRYLVTNSSDEIGFNWDSDFWLDVAVFEQVVNRVRAQPALSIAPTEIQALETALQLYKGDLLEGFYDDWALVERERLRSLFLDSLDYLMRYYQHQQAYDRCLEIGHQILRYEPANEAIHRAVMQFFALVGQREAAIRQYQRCCHILSRELDLPPLPETKWLHTQIVQGKRLEPPQDIAPSEKTDLSQALEQLNIAHQGMLETQHQVEWLKRRLDQAQRQFHQALRLIETLTEK